MMTKKVRKGLSALNKARRFHATFNFAKFLTSLRIEIHTFRTPLTNNTFMTGLAKEKSKSTQQYSPLTANCSRFLVQSKCDQGSKWRMPPLPRGDILGKVEFSQRS